MNKTIITVALTGSQGSKKNNLHTPVTSQEIIDNAYQCYLKGASIVHIHTKAEDGETPEINYDMFKEIKEGIQKKCDMIINFSTSGEYNMHEGLDLIGTADAYQTKRVKVVENRPDMASFDIPTMNFNEKIFMNPLSFLRKLGVTMKDYDVLPEIEIYSSGDILATRHLQEEGYLSDNVLYQLVLGIRGGAPADVKNLLHLVESLPEGANWSAFGIGKHHLQVIYATLALDGHIRVGLEDNLYYSKGRLATNIELVERASRIIKEYGNSVATPKEAREILSI